MMEKRTLGAAYKFYCEKELVDAHSAEADATATWEILEAQLDRYEHLGEHLILYCNLQVKKNMWILHVVL